MVRAAILGLFASSSLWAAACGSSVSSSTSGSGGSAPPVLPCADGGCDPRTQFCLLTYGPSGLAGGDCHPLGKDCGCECLEPLPECLCYPEDAGVTVHCMPGQ